MSLPYNTEACFIEKPGIIHSLKKKKTKEKERRKERNPVT